MHLVTGSSDLSGGVEEKVAPPRGRGGGNRDRGGTSVRVPDSFTVVTGALAFSSASRPFSYYSVALLRQDWNVEAGVTKVRG